MSGNRGVGLHGSGGTHEVCPADAAKPGAHEVCPAGAAKPAQQDCTHVRDTTVQSCHVGYATMAGQTRSYYATMAGQTRACFGKILQ